MTHLAGARTLHNKRLITNYNSQIVVFWGGMGDLTTIPVSKATRDRLRALGRKGETYDQLLNRLMDVYRTRPVEFEPVE